jgi:hypothetical protein
VIKELFINLGLKEKMKKQVQVIKIEIIRHGRLLIRAPYIKVIFSFCVAKRPGRSERAGSGLYHFGLFWRQSPCGSPSLRSHMDLSENRKENQEPQKLFFSLRFILFHSSPNKLFD